MSSESPELLLLCVGPTVALVSMVAARRRPPGAARRRAQWTFWVAIPIAAVLAAAALLIWPDGPPQEWEQYPSNREIMLGGFALLTTVAWLMLGATELLMRLASLVISTWRARASAHPSDG